MCLIITGPASKIRSTLLETPQLLSDIYWGNKDGIGSMYASDDGLVVVNKLVPSTGLDVMEFIRQLPDNDRDLALHFRMRTHGDVDLTNCHPYPIVEGSVHMMHNGVIRNVDDTSDPTKSDTWHYINQVLQPQLVQAPAIMSVPAWQKLVAEDIGKGNRFVFLNRDGQMVILNKDEGIEHDGLWFSNTYAWSPEILIPTYESKWSYGGLWRRDEDDARWTNTGAVNYPGSAAFEESLWSAVHECDADLIYKKLDEYPITTLSTLFKHDAFVCSVEMSELAQQDAKIAQLLEAGAEAKLAKYCRKSAGRCRKVAEVIAWYGSWVGKNEKAEASAQAPLFDAQGDGVEEADEESLRKWHEDFREWMERQGSKTVAVTQEQKQPAKWTAQTPALFRPPAQVAPIGKRTIMYRGYRIETSAELLEAGKTEDLKAFLETEVQRLHAEDLARLPKKAGKTWVNDGSGWFEVDEKAAPVEATNEAYAG